LASFR